MIGLREGRWGGGRRRSDDDDDDNDYDNDDDKDNVPDIARQEVGVRVGMRVRCEIEETSSSPKASHTHR